MSYLPGYTFCNILIIPCNNINKNNNKLYLVTKIQSKTLFSSVDNSI